MTSEEKRMLKKHEFPKSEKEIALINLANEETSRLMEKVGVEPYDVPLDNIHIITLELFQKVINEKGVMGATTYYKQGIILDAKEVRDEPIKFGLV